MQLIRQSASLVRSVRVWRRRGRSIGFVPTMGALHEGHLSLIRAARRQTDVVIVSIFVNPLQFGPAEDFARYPRHLRRDAWLAQQAGCDLVFAPTAREMYPPDFSSYVDVAGLGNRLEGAARPGHFRGVATVVAKLFCLAQPTIAYVGQKDYQQALIIQRLVADLSLPIRVRVMPTVREPDGLAMSSRNAYLNQDQRRQASVIFRALSHGRDRIRAGERRADRLVRAMRAMIARAPAARIEYVAIVDAATLAPLRRVAGRVAVLAAVRIGSTRLIDNVLVDVP